MKSARPKYTLSTALAVCLVSHAFANDPKSLHVSTTAAPPVIDGRVDPGEWDGAACVDDLHEVRPNEFQPPSEGTQWFVTYDNRNLYVAAIASDSQPALLSAKSLSQGADIESDDSLHILVDAFNNKRSGYTFALNPNSVRYDAVYTNGTRQSEEWDGVWRGAASMTDSGWSMEMAIPFNTLTFDPDNETWGVNFWREIPRRNETIAWSSRNGRVDPTVSGEMTGFRDLSQGLGLDLIPSVSTTYVGDHVTNESDTDFKPSLDVSYKLGSSFNALLTLNTDFAATEVDDRQLGLTRFSLFFPEKRSFFLTDFDIFQFGGVPTGSGRSARQVGLVSGTNGLAFFSRRVGLSASREPVDLLYGTKLSGRVGSFDFGTLYIRQDDHEDVQATDIFVGRVTRAILAESVVGLIFTDGDPQSDDDGSLAGIDFLYRNTRLPDNRSLDIQAWLQKSDRPGVDDDDLAYSIVLSLPTRTGFSVGAQYQRVEANFDPALGFANRVGVRLYGLQGEYRHLRSGNGRIEQVRSEFSYSRWEYLDSGDVQTEDLEWEIVDLRSRANDALRFGVSRRTEGLLPGENPLEDIGITIPPGEYTFDRYSATLRSADHRTFAFDLRISDGDYYQGERLEVSPEIEWAPNAHLQFAVEYEYNDYDFPGQSASTRELSFRNDIAFNSAASLSTLLQYDDVSDDIGINMRFRYNVTAGRDLWLVVNHNVLDDEANDRFRSTRTSAAAKLRYTFRF